MRKSQISTAPSFIYSLSPTFPPSLLDPRSEFPRTEIQRATTQVRHVGLVRRGALDLNDVGARRDMGVDEGPAENRVAVHDAELEFRGRRIVLDRWGREGGTGESDGSGNEGAHFEECGLGDLRLD